MQPTHLARHHMCLCIAHHRMHLNCIILHRMQLIPVSLSNVQPLLRQHGNHLSIGLILRASHCTDVPTLLILTLLILLAFSGSFNSLHCHVIAPLFILIRMLPCIIVLLFRLLAAWLLGCICTHLCSHESVLRLTLCGLLSISAFPL